MFRGSEPQDALSFSDETSRQNNEKTARLVWTHAQISKFANIQWFLELRNLYPDVKSELKSSQVVDNFDKLPRDIRRRVSSGLRGARIHIVDTFAYEAESKQVMRRIYKCDNYEKVLRENENKEFAKLLIKGMEEWVAKQILLDSPAQRLEQNLQTRGMAGFGYVASTLRQESGRKELALDLDLFEKGNKRITDTAAKYVSRSGVVLSDAVEFSGRSFLGEYHARQVVAQMVNQSHAFDAGDDAAVRWVKGQRDHFAINTVYGLHGFLSPLYGDIDSKLSSRTQAADIAARIGQRIYDENGLEGLLDQFDYVTFNGERITETNIKARLEYWRTITEREERIEKLIDGLR
ncbi:MAG: hypothetical protein KF881_00600 [Acidobacteria bacterium]|nr:hypothetical protein [Acidobacteriota bacterium]